ncbi:hypothetical protein TBR22_A29630 [Luteitalea sp. TBR-22]|uniref:DUF4397 domain-containing protein n=1 Tax=Luteitalea sp. TBR-22 TaxID=2802971 RepID=UPI001AF28890|nr:DUF4397 domain-containing protein [Luteitalea sp. TBR-22]BCS33736.1 hypothetical protein TBR22_A29630 [Luteitalea sp. TBR-22]
MKRVLHILTAGLCVLGAAAPALAQSQPARVVVVHGIPGGAVGAAADLPVDVSVNGACALPGFRYRQIVGPLALPAGTISVAVHPANPSRPCGLPAIIGPANITLNPNEDAAIIAHLTAAGAPTASKYTVDLTPTVNNKSRVHVFHTAAAPAVDVYLGADYGSFSQTAFLVRQLTNREGAVSTVPTGNWQLVAAVSGTVAPVIGPAHVNIGPDAAFLFFIVGAPGSNTLDVVVKDYTNLGRP